MPTLWPEDSATVRLWSFTRDVLVESADTAYTLLLVTRWGEFVIGPGEAVVAESLHRMAFGPVSLRNTIPITASGRPDSRSARTVARVLDRLSGAVVHSLALPDGHGPVLSVEPLVVAPPFRPRPVPQAARVRLPRFAALRPEDGLLVLECPGAPYRGLLGHPAARVLVTTLVQPVDPAALAVATGLSPGVVGDMLSFLVAAGVVLVASPTGTFAEDYDADLRTWTQHELQFHAGSRHRTRTDPDHGDLWAGPPAVTRPLPGGRRFRLRRPDLDAVRRADPPLSELLETAGDVPRLGVGVPTVVQLGELLYRAAGIRSVGPAPVAPGVAPAYESSQRPYSSLAGLYELELFVTVDRCTGLARGIYHYDPLDHALTLVEETEDRVDGLLDAGRLGAGSPRRPALLMSIAARIGRVSWIFPGGAYAVALQHCGSFQETLRLVASAMGLAAYAVRIEAHGVDDLLGLRWPAEVGLGECLIDLLPDG